VLFRSDRLRVTARGDEREGELLPDPRPRQGAGCEAERLVEVRDALVVLAGMDLRDPGVAQDLRTQFKGRRLGQRAAEVRRGRLRCSPLRRAGRRLPEHGDDPFIARRVDSQQMRCDRVGGDAIVGEHPRRAAVAPRALSRREVAVNRASDHRMDELERAFRAQDVDHDERVGRVHGLVFEQAGECGRVPHLRPLAQHGHRTRELHGSLAGRAQAAQDRLRHPPRDDLLEALPARLRRRHALGARAGEKLTEEEGVSAGGRPAGGREFRLGPLAEHRSHERLRARLGERLGMQDLGNRVGHQVEQRGGAVALFGARRARSDHEKDRKLLDPAGEVGEEAQRRYIGPVRVVDGEEERAAPGQVHRQPVEPMEDREGVARRHCLGLAVTQNRARQGRGVAQ
jgi:hypothetical protein